MEIFLLFVRIILFAILALAGIGKLFDLEGSKNAVENFGVPKSISRLVAVLLPIAEIIIAILLIPVNTSWYAAIATAILMSIFVVGMLWQIIFNDGNMPDCHCFGQIHSEPVSYKSLARNLLFLMLSFILIFSGRGEQGYDLLYKNTGTTDMNGLQALLGLVVIGFLAAIVYFLKQISEQQDLIMRRIEVLDLISKEDGAVTESAELVEPDQEGFLIGKRLPAIALKSLDGNSVSLDSIIDKKKSTLLLFVSPSCQPCESLLPEVAKWKRELASKTRILLISSGKAKDNRKKFEKQGFDEIYLQDLNELAETIGAKWTPTAVLVNRDGTIASKPAPGDSAIEKLIEQIRECELVDGFVYPKGDVPTSFGEVLPEFELKDLDGNSFSNESLGKGETVLIYWSVACPYCLEMIEDIRKFENEQRADSPRLVFLSSGDIEGNREMGLKSTILIDDERILANKINMYGTPTALLIGRDGRIISEACEGSENISSLIGWSTNESN